MSHSYEKCFGKRSEQQSIKEGLGEDLGNRADTIKNYKKYQHKWKKELKVPKNQNKMLFRISKKSLPRCKEKKIKEIKVKVSNKLGYSISNSSRSDSDSYSSISSDSD